MSYFVFDLDETLAQIYTIYYFVASLQTYPNMSKSLTNSLKKAYKTFVKRIVEEEIKNPLGVLRPGILHIMKKLYELYRVGKVNGVIIYSNNGHLYSLEFIRDLIHEYIGDELIIECVDRYHYLRKKDDKTWDELKQILTKGKCKARNVKPCDVYFFDDLKHKDLDEHLENYNHVPEYNFKASFDRIANIYKDLLIDREFIEILKNEKIKNIDDVIEIFRIETQDTELIPPESDDGIKMMLDAIKKIGILGKRKVY